MHVMSVARNTLGAFSIAFFIASLLVLHRLARWPSFRIRGRKDLFNEIMIHHQNLTNLMKLKRMGRMVAPGYEEAFLVSNNSRLPKLSCFRLAVRDSLELERAISFGHSASPASVEKVSDCQTYRRGFVNMGPSAEEKEFPLAFAIRMHVSPRQAERMIRALWAPQHVFCVHVDKKSPPSVHRYMAAIANCLPNVFLSSVSVRFVYSSFSAVEADLVCMRDLLARSDRWKYLLNMAGQEFPLKTNLEIVRILKMLNGTNDIELYPLPKLFLHRVVRRHLIRNDSVLPTIQPKAPFKQRNLTLMKGCSYNTFSRSFVHWALTDLVTSQFIEWSRDTSSPDELVWATLNTFPTAPGGYTVNVTQMAGSFLSREISWDYIDNFCYGKYVRQVCTFGAGDLTWLQHRSGFVANKFDTEYDDVALACIEKARINRVNKGIVHVNWDLVMKLPHVASNANETNNH